MNRKNILKSGILSVMLVAMVLATVIPAASALEFISREPPNSSKYGEGIAAGGTTVPVGDYYTNNNWHIGRWLDGCQRYEGNLYFTIYANGSPMSSSTSGNTYDTSSSTWLTSIGASSTSTFYDSRYGYFSHTAVKVELT